ncbi:DUF3040 domain-containing protein [Leucobacter sp. cx-328]|uniref:DUF3040 domain-containing protein n=1 Tax=unclassified Leucobacter TaxID=2621730 RepID=UPI00165D3B54|nr:MULTISPECIES: DUF3040 domain-containing protein [unclassified Leucobacter]MBC9944848.1 DUF3040 domain-containing protein [Leucobacter sp. cx-328]
MALSEHEQRLLDEMERRFYQSEADVLPTTGASRPALSYRMIVLGTLLTLLGIGVMVAGVAGQMLWLGLVGFAAMVGGVVLFFTRRENDPEAVVSGKARAGAAPKAAAAKETLSDRMERRWNERMEGER